jgi:hypothetical protein
MIILWLLLCLIYGTAAVTDGERQALLRMLRTLDGDRWFVKDGWADASTTANPCDWFGISCDTQSRVAEINLSHNNLRGSISDLDFAPFVGLTRIDLSSNTAINGTPPNSLFALPQIFRIQLSRNQLTGIPTAMRRGPVSVTLQQLYLAGNPFSCPLPRQSDLSPVVIAAWLDVNSSTCRRSVTRSLARSRTVIAEVPVPPLPDNYTHSVIGSLLLPTSLDVAVAATISRFTATFIVFAVDLLVLPDSNASSSSVFTVAAAQTPRAVVLRFEKGAPLTFRQNILSRFVSRHPSISPLMINGLVRISETADEPGISSSTTAPSTPTTGSNKVSRGAVIAVLVVGIVLVVVLFVVLGLLWFCRRKAFTPVEPMPGPPPIKQQFGTSRSLRTDHAAESLSQRAPSMVRSTSMRARSRSDSMQAKGATAL